MSRRIESLFIPGPAGRIEAMLEEPPHGAIVEAALVLHPHPLYGGTMHNKVVHRLARGLRRAGCATLRFNFRGVNLSEGAHDEGCGEAADALAALALIESRYPGLPVTLAGFSFGSRVAVRLASQLGARAPRRLVLAGYPALYSRHDLLFNLPRPRIFLHSTNDEFGPKSALEALFRRVWGPKRLIWIEASDHFFSGALDELERQVAGL